MTPILFALLAPPQSPAASVMKRLSEYINRAHTLEATYALTSNRIKSPGIATLAYERPTGLCYTVKWAGTDYRFVRNRIGSWDADYRTKVYDEVANWPFYSPVSRIPTAPTSFFRPGFLIDGTFQGEPVEKPKYVGTATVEGALTDEVEAVGLGEDLRLFVDKSGKPLRYVVTRGPASVQMELKSIALNNPVNESLFANNPPIGFAPYTVQMPVYPLTIGDKFPLSGWRTKGNFDPQGGESFVMVTAPDCEPSGRAAGVLRDLAAKGSFKIAIASLDPSGAVPGSLAGYPVLFDPSDNLPRKINAPGTPLFYLLGPSGTVMKVWFGFDPENAAGFEEDVVGTASKSVPR